MAETSVIARGTVVRGNVRGSGALEIQGRVEGDVSVTGDVLLGEAGAIRGNVSGESLTIFGQVQGDLRGTEAVIVERGAKVAGDLSAPKIGVASGALVRGMVRTDGEPALTPGRRSGASGQGLRSGSFQKPAARAEAPKPAPVAAELDSEAPPAAKEERKPPPPVVPALARGAKAKKKKSREQGGE